MRLFQRGPKGWWAGDFRQWYKGRLTLRDPDASGWPGRRAGERTQFYEVAVQWSQRYVEHFQEEIRRRQTKAGVIPRQLAKAADDFIDHRKEIGKATNTWQNDRAAVNHLRIFAGEDKPSGARGDNLSTDRLTEEFLQRFFKRLRDEGYSYNTRVGIRRGVSQFMLWLGYGDDNAARRIEILPSESGGGRNGNPDVRTWTEGELKRIRAAANRLDARPDLTFRQNRLALELALHTGARRNELFALRWEQINHSAYTIRITHQVHKEVPRLVRLKGTRARTALILPGWWDFHAQVAEFSGGWKPDAEGFILGTDGGGLRNPRRYDAWRRALLTEAGVYRVGVGWHIDRHTYAYEFIAQGGRKESLQKSLGHSSMITTENYYDHFLEDIAAADARRRIYRDEGLRVVS